MNRRDLFKSLLGGAIAAHSLDLEKLLWVPGKLISIPKPMPGLAFNKDAFSMVWPPFQVGDIISFGSFPQQYRIIRLEEDRAVFEKVNEDWMPALAIGTD